MKTDEAPPECRRSGTHIGMEVARYYDGVLLTHCQFCGVRMEIGHVAGGIDAQIVADLSNSILGGELPMDARFTTMVDDLQANYEEIGRALKIARWVQQERG